MRMVIVDILGVVTQLQIIIKVWMGSWMRNNIYYVQSTQQVLLDPLLLIIACKY